MVLPGLPPSPPPYHSLALTLGRTERGTRMAGGTWNMLAPYGVLQALRRLSFPVLTNHLPAGERKRASGCDPLPLKEDLSRSGGCHGNTV